MGSSKVTPAFRWKDGKIIALSVGGIHGLNVEYKCLHLQKRTMGFTPGLENENSFMVIPNEFVQDHELAEEELHALMVPDPQYAHEIWAKYPGLWVLPKPSILQRIKRLIKNLIMRAVKNDPDKILHLKRRWNRLIRRTLTS